MIVGVFFLSAIRILAGINHLNSDFFSFWLAGRMIWTHENPYLAINWIQGRDLFGSTWIPESGFLYPLPLALFYAPLGLLTPYHAFLVWIVLLEIMIGFSVLLLFRHQVKSLRIHYLIPFLAGVILFRPTLITLFDGQISGLVLLILTGVILFWEKDKWIFGAVLLPLIALKPNLGIPVIIFLTFWLFIQKKVRALIALICSGLFLVMIGMAINPHWITDYLAIGSSKIVQTFGYSPTLWGLTALLMNFSLKPTLIFGGAAVSGLLIGIIYLIWKKRNTITPLWNVGLAITTTLLVTPYTWSYDQLLLVIPIFAITLEMMKRNYPYLLTACIFILVDIITYILLIITARMELEIIYVFIPLIILGAQIVYIASSRKILESEINLVQH